MLDALRSMDAASPGLLVLRINLAWDKLAREGIAKEGYLRGQVSKRIDN